MEIHLTLQTSLNGSIELIVAQVAGVNVSCVRSGVLADRRLNSTEDLRVNVSGLFNHYYSVTVPRGMDSREIIRKLEASDLFQILDLWTTLGPASDTGMNTSAEILAGDLNTAQAAFSWATLLIVLLVCSAVLCGASGVFFLKKCRHADDRSDLSQDGSIINGQCCFPLSGSVPRQQILAENARNGILTESCRSCTAADGRSPRGKAEEAPMHLHQLQQAATAEVTLILRGRGLSAWRSRIQVVTAATRRQWYVSGAPGLHAVHPWPARHDY